MLVKFKKTVFKKTSQIDGFDIEANGFVPTWAYRTDDQSQSFWEFDVLHIETGLETHVVIPFTVNTDVLETLLVREFTQINSHVNAWIQSESSEIKPDKPK